MINLNIAPDDLKKEIKFYRIHFLLKKIYSIFIIIVSLYAILLLVANLILSAHFIKTINETTLVTKNTGNYTNEVRSINNLIDYLDKIQEDSIKWSYLLEFLNLNIADDIKLNQIIINKEKNELILSGYSGTRDSLILLKESLEKSNYFKTIDFPIKNLLEKNDISFQIKAEFEKYEFN